MREELRKYVMDSEPPMGLTASALIGKGRSQRRWRTGLGLGGGTAAMGLALAAAIMMLSPAGAGLPVAASPSAPTPSPSPSAGCALPLATPWQTPTVFPSPTAGTSNDHAKVATEITYMADHPANCFLAKWLTKEFPTAVFAAHPYKMSPPMTLERRTQAQGNLITYQVMGEIRIGNTITYLTIDILKETPGMRAAQVPKTGFASKTYNNGPGHYVIDAWTGSSNISVQTGSDSNADTTEWMMRLAKSPELDLFK